MNQPTASPALRRLVHEHLIGKSEGMPAASLAAFVLGWGSAFELMRRSQAMMPWISAQQHQWVNELLDAIEVASRVELDAEDETEPGV